MVKMLRTRLSLMVFLEYAVWGSYMISIGMFLSSIGLGSRIGLFFAAQGIAALFMPALCGIIADRLVQPQRLYGLCHLLSAAFMGLMAFECSLPGAGFARIFIPYCLGILFFIPTISLTNSICFTLLGRQGMDPAQVFPGIRMWGTVGFICAMWAVNFLGIQASYMQFVLRTVLGIVLAAYALLLPACTLMHESAGRSAGELMGIGAFKLFRSRDMAVFFLFAMAFGICLHISNGYAGPYMESFAVEPRFSASPLVRNSMLVLSVSQISEALCTLLIPVCLKRLGVRKVFMVAALAWTVRYVLLAFGNPAGRAWMLVIAMVMYGLAFDFFNIAASIYVDRNTEGRAKSSGQGLLLMMTNGFGASVGMLAMQYVMNLFTGPEMVGGRFYTLGNWQGAWLAFAGFTFAVFVLLALFFKEKTDMNDGK
ncbi:MAG: MFS transporter [Bacteroidaceae bacterium]|nr:MFS transporter [Bacteroidaceae bacterium]